VCGEASQIEAGSPVVVDALARTSAAQPRPGELARGRAGRGAEPTPPDDVAKASASARIGPNAILQTRRALAERYGVAAVHALDADAALPEVLPPGMIPEAWFVRAVAALRARLPRAEAEAVLTTSGRYTADYVRMHRIPRAFRALLALLPARIAIPVLLAAIRRHAWTFAGAGTFRAVGGFPRTLILDACPTCRALARAEPAAGASTKPTAGRGGAYYEAAFERLLSLASPRVRVRETRCVADGARHCRFELTLAPRRRDVRGDAP
jgi:divinyl protochlorophyllide a 8-vinyl-reductase